MVEDMQKCKIYLPNNNKEQIYSRCIHRQHPKGAYQMDCGGLQAKEQNYNFN
jgi:hypothetical protein